ncbi:ABC transporter ATP-binding protein [Kitasatospora sp. NBC_01250]|uniref:ABC transporter ATP-binding protein n=1 Tax=unclassified Kitasatospora TaxID=2633591 RepID=UPI002E164347|nr:MULTISPECIES: ABC transporter ATP-binding protein [unclassified Kitasatospora]WSJ67002.1 ABC transporter ATP-binding protein [Kitasatospora sp. NBC_01302]
MTEQHPALAAHGLGRHYRRGWALRNCSFRLPAGRICALVGPNGAGKSTLMGLAAGLLSPSEGRIEVDGRVPRPGGSPEVAFVAQDKPLYPRFTVAETLRMGRELNPRWEQGAAEEVLAGAFPLTAKVGSLSGGQRTRVAMALAIGKRPDLLILDEPMADLDPLARHELMGRLMAEAAERGLTVLMSSHVVAELQESCDYLVLLAGGRVRLAGDIEELLAAHRLVVGPQRAAATLAGHQLVESRENGRGVTVLLRPSGELDDQWEGGEPTLEELLLAHLRAPDIPALLTAEARVQPNDLPDRTARTTEVTA